MSSPSLALGRPTLVDRVIPRSLVTDIVLVAAGAGLTSAVAQIVIPIHPVPITGQTFAVLLVGATLGASRGAISLALYAVLGLVGLPVFAPQTDGSHLTGAAAFGASGGYIVGFILGAALVGWLAQLEWDRKVVRTLVAFIAGSIAIYAVGLPWLALSLHLTLAQTLQFGFTPFLVGDVAKALLAAGLLPATWYLVRRLDKSK